MEMQPLDRIEDHASGETPEDVAILYSWANLEGAKYRDFSANRREYRAQMRHRAAEQLRLMELRAQSEAEAAAVEAEAEAAAAHAEADAASVKLAASRSMQASGLFKASTGPEDMEAEEQVEHMRRSSLREAAQQARRAAAERLEAARRAEAAALADSIARREEREIAEAQASALRQAAQYAESEARSRQKKATQPEDLVPGRISDPYGPQVVAEGEYFERPGTPVSELEASRFRHQREYIEHNTGADLPEFRLPESFAETPQRTPQPRESRTPQIQRPRGYQPDEPSGRHPARADESVTGTPSNGSFAEHSTDLEPRNHHKPVYEERHLSIARDAHRLDEAGAIQLRREHERAGGQGVRPAGLDGRVVVPSIPYKEFRRTNGAGSSQPPPEGARRVPEPLPEQPVWPGTENLARSPHSDSRSVRAAHRNSPRGGDMEDERWAFPATFADEANPAREMPMEEGKRAPRPQYPEAPVQSAARSSELATELPSRGSPNGNGTGAGASVPARDSWGVAWDHPDPRVADRQPAWTTRPDLPRPESPRPEASGASAAQPAANVEPSGPAWLYPKTQGPRFVDSLADSNHRRRAELAVQSLRVGSGQTLTQPARDAAAAAQAQPQTSARNREVENTLQHSREQVASRWFALKGIFARADRDQKTDQQPSREAKRNTPFVVVYSLAGGVGKTSLVATLGRALSSQGEKVLLTDTTTQGLLPFYFGASELHPGVVRTFSPPSGSADASIHMVSFDFTAEKHAANNGHDAQREMFEELVGYSQQANRVLMDLNATCGWMVARMAWMKPTVLVPLAADMNSVISLQSVERSFHGLQDAEGKPLQPLYLLNQFDPTLPLHLDVREVLKQQLGDRLLPFVVRRASGVSEALAEGMTVVDYDPESDVAKDYMGVANWLRNDSAPATVGLRNLRWSER